jgi:hypothetical protein
LNVGGLPSPRGLADPPWERPRSISRPNPALWETSRSPRVSISTQVKPVRYSLLVFVVPGLFAAEPAEAPGPVRTSPRLAQEIRAGLPKFVPPTPRPAAESAGIQTTPDDPDVLKLPRFVIRERRIPTNDPDVWLTDRAIQQKAMSAYQDSMTPFEWALNSWYIPLFSSPPSARARQYYESRKFADEVGRLNTLINLVGLTDPKEAAKLRDAMDSRKLPKEN